MSTLAGHPPGRLRRGHRPTPTVLMALALILAGLPGLIDAQEVPASEDARAAVSSRMPRVTLSWTRAPLREVLRAFAFYSSRSIVAGSGVDQVFVTADIEDQPWDLALQAILDSRGLRATENEAGIIRVEALAAMASRELVQPLAVRSYRVSYVRVAELQATIQPLLSARGSVSIHESSNTLVVSDVDRVHRVIRELMGR